MKKQHGISAPPKQANFMRGPRGRPKKPASALNMESVDEVAWGGPDAGYAHAQMAPQHKDLSARPVGQVPTYLGQDILEQFVIFVEQESRGGIISLVRGSGVSGTVVWILIRSSGSAPLPRIRIL